jgi:hypothetical protein
MKWSQAVRSSILSDGLCAQTDEAKQNHMGSGHLRVDLEGDEIVVRKPGTSLLLAYTKSVDQLRLVLTRSWMKSTSALPAINEFRDQAYEAANNKARELGWMHKEEEAPGQGYRGFLRGN